MKIARIGLSIVGGLMLVLGLIWIGQGSGYFPYPASSFMINQSPWIYRGAALAAAGLIVLFALRRFWRRH